MFIGPPPLSWMASAYIGRGLDDDLLGHFQLCDSRAALGPLWVAVSRVSKTFQNHCSRAVYFFLSF